MDIFAIFVWSFQGAKWDLFDPNIIRNNSANAIGIMRNLANTLVTLSFNINLILEELEQGKKIEPEKYKDITRKIQYCTALDPENQFRFTSSV